jgi:hypothetical protein
MRRVDLRERITVFAQRLPHPIGCSQHIRRDRRSTRRELERCRRNRRDIAGQLDLAQVIERPEPEGQCDFCLFLRRLPGQLVSQPRIIQGQ